MFNLRPSSTPGESQSYDKKFTVYLGRKLITSPVPDASTESEYFLQENKFTNLNDAILTLWMGPEVAETSRILLSHVWKNKI